jgi:probable phosphoglycerate mutase
MRLLWVRHGQMKIRASLADDPAAIDRFFNQEEQGGLSDRGCWQADEAARRLVAEGISAVYSSPLARARQTAAVTASACGLEVKVTDAITEVRTGHLREGTLAARWARGVTGSTLPPALKRPILGGTLIPLYFHAWLSGRTVGGETPEEVKVRMRAFLRELERAHPPDATVALFAHGYLLVTLTYGLGPRGRLALLRRPYIRNGAICEMRLTNGALGFVRHADASHLRR